jgi:hypothetical protein
VSKLTDTTICPNTTTYEKFLPHPNKSNMSSAMRRSQVLSNTRISTMRFGVSYLGQKVEQPIIAPTNRMDH